MSLYGIWARLTRYKGYHAFQYRCPSEKGNKIREEGAQENYQNDYGKQKSTNANKHVFCVKCVA